MILWFDELGSTNTEARDRGAAGETGPLWIAARRQTAGKGRRGRDWATGEANLAATLLTTTERPLAEAAGVAFVAALAVADMASAYLSPDLVKLKWPNDVLADERKLAGILVESGPRDGGAWLAVGIGVNLAAAPALDTPVAAVADFAPAPTPEIALETLAEAFEQWWTVWNTEGLAPILAAWTARSHGIPGPCTARLPSETVMGTAEGLDSDGRLRLRLPSGELRRIAAGDVFFGQGET